MKMISEEFMTIMRASLESIMVVTLDRVIVAWSPGAERVFGFTSAEIVGRSSDVLVPSTLLGSVDEEMNLVERGHTVGLYVAQRFTKNRDVVFVETSLTPIANEDGKIDAALVISRDVTDRKRTEDALQQRLMQQEAVADLGQSALAGEEPNSLIQGAVRRVAQALNVEFCKVLELMPDKQSFLLCAGVGWRPGLVGKVTLSASEGSQGAYTLQSSVPVIVENLLTETRFRGPQLLLQHGVVSGVSVIIRGLESTFGVLSVHSTSQRVFTKDDIHFLQSVANVLGEAIQHKQAQEDHDARANAEKSLAEVQAGAARRALVLETANRVALNILSNRVGVEALRHIAEAARVLSGARYAALGVAAADGKRLQEFITVGLTPKQQEAIGPLPIGHGVLGALLGSNAPLRIDNLGEHPASSGFPPNHPPMNSFLGVPIRRGESVLGSLYLTNKQGGNSFTEADESAVVALAGHAAIAIHHLYTLARQRALVRSLMTAQEEERRALAHDLHDGLTQYVMASHLQLEAFQRSQGQGNPEKAQRELRQGLAYLKEAVLESRRLVNGLRTLVLDDLGLGEALGQLLRENQAQSQWMDATFGCDLGARRFDPALETAVYRVAQEALNNIRKHAETQRVEIGLKLEGNIQESERLVLRVKDWGQGFDPSQQVHLEGHFGLHGMNERVRLLGGTLSVESRLGEGAIIEASFPVLPSPPGGVSESRPTTFPSGETAQNGATSEETA